MLLRELLLQLRVPHLHPRLQILQLQPVLLPVTRLVLQLLVPPQLVQLVLNPRKLPVVLLLKGQLVLVVCFRELPFFYFFDFLGRRVRLANGQGELGGTGIGFFVDFDAKSLPQLLLEEGLFL